MVNLKNTREVENKLRELIKIHGGKHVFDNILSKVNGKLTLSATFLRDYTEFFDLSFIINKVKIYDQFLYYLEDLKVITSEDRKLILSMDNDAISSHEFMTIIYPNVRHLETVIQTYMSKINFSDEFLIYNRTILTLENLIFQTCVSNNFIEENIEFFEYIVKSGKMNELLSYYHLSEDIVRKYHQPIENYPVEFFNNQNLSNEFLLTIDSPNNPVVSDEKFVEMLRYNVTNNIDLKTETEKHFKKFAQYKIYAKEIIHCVDEDYEHDGMLVYDDGYEYKDPDEYLECLKDNGYFEDIEYSSMFDKDDIEEGLKDWDSMFDDCKWDFLKSFCEEYNDDASFIYYRYEKTLKNICFSYKEALKLLPKYKDAYIQIDSILNDDIRKLKDYFRGN